MTELVVNIFNSIIFTALYVAVLMIIYIRMKIDDEKRKFIAERNLYSDKVLINELKRSSIINLIFIGLFILLIILTIKSYLYLFSYL